METLKTIGAIVLIAIVAGAVGGIIGNAGKVPAPLGATVYNRAISFDEGILVDQTERISGTGGASFTTGAFSSTLDVAGEMNVQDFVQGGGVLAYTAEDGTDSITAAQICDYSVIQYNATASIAVASTTLPSDETLLQDCLTTVGDSKEILFRNVSTAASTTELLAGDSIVLLEPDGQNVVIAGIWKSSGDTSGTPKFFSIFSAAFLRSP